MRTGSLGNNSLTVKRASVIVNATRTITPLSVYALKTEGVTFVVRPCEVVTDLMGTIKEGLDAPLYLVSGMN